MGLLLKDYLTLAVVGLGILLTILRKRQKRAKKGGSTEEIPSARFTSLKLPLVNGIVTFLTVRKEGLPLLDRVVRECPTKIIKWPVVNKTVYLTWDADIIQRICKSTSEVDYVDKPSLIYDVVLPSVLNNGLLACNLDVWTRHRKAAQLAFTYKSVLNYVQYTNGCARELLDIIFSLERKLEGEPLTHQQVKGALDHCILKLVTQVIAGSDCSFFSNEELLTFFETFRTGKEVSVERMLSPWLLLPPVWLLHPKRQKMEAMATAGYKFAMEVIRRYETKTDKNCNDVAEISSKDPSGVKPSKPALDVDDSEVGAKPFGCLVEQLMSSGLSTKEIADEVITFLAAGHETVLVALDMFIFQLARHPAYQKLCQEEVDLMFDSHSEKHGPSTDNFTMDEVSTLKYMERCIQESMRLTPVVPLFARILRAPLQVTPNVTLPPGEMVAVSPWATHRHPDYFPQPEVFDPDRFLTKNVKQRHPFSYLPFSLGARNCVGYKVALNEMKIFMAYILRHYDLSTTDGPDDVRIFFDVTIRPERLYKVTYTRRQV